MPLLDEKEQEKPQEEEESYSFLQETIKPKKISRKMLIQQFVRIALYGLIFGGVASLGFFAVKPAAQRWLKGKPETVTIPEDDTPSGQEDAAAGNQKRELYLSVRHRRKKTGMRRQRGSPRLYQG